MNHKKCDCSSCAATYDSPVECGCDYCQKGR